MFRSLWFIACASASSLWSPAYRAIVRDDASRRKVQSSFHEVEEQAGESAKKWNASERGDAGTLTVSAGGDRDGRITEGAENDTANKGLINETNTELNQVRGNIDTSLPRVEVPIVPSGVSEPLFPQEEDNESHELVKNAAKDLGPPVDEKDPEEKNDILFNKAETVINIIQKRLNVINVASTKIGDGIKQHRQDIKLKREAYGKFVNEVLNPDLKTLKDGMAQINKGAGMIAVIRSEMKPEEKEEFGLDADGNFKDDPDDDD